MLGILRRFGTVNFDFFFDQQFRDCIELKIGLPSFNFRRNISLIVFKIGMDGRIKMKTDEQ
jgi:hypothetical protein